MLELAGYEFNQGHSSAAAETADRVLRYGEAMSDTTDGALTSFAPGPASGKETRPHARSTLRQRLEILPDLDGLPREDLDALSDIALAFGLAEMSDLIRKSPASDLLLPLTTALERESGLEPRVAKEVEEVAEDIRRNMRERRMKMNCADAQAAPIDFYAGKKNPPDGGFFCD